MVSGDSDRDIDPLRRQQIVATARRALVFGETAARHTGDAPFNDPILETYFLLFVLGALDYYSRHVDGGAPLSDGEKLGAMAEALDAFGATTPEETRATVVMLAGAADEAALKIRRDGADAAQRWADLGDADAARHFARLLADPDNFPRVVEPVRRDPLPRS